MRLYVWLTGLLLALAVPTAIYWISIGQPFIDTVTSVLWPAPVDFEYHDSYFIVINFQMFIVIGLLTFVLFMGAAWLRQRRKRRKAIRGM